MYMKYDTHTLGWTLPWGWHIDAPWTKHPDAQNAYDTTNTQNFNTGANQLPQPTYNVPADEPPTPPKKFPWKNVLIGAGVGLLLIGSVYLYMRKR